MFDSQFCMFVGNVGRVSSLPCLRILIVVFYYVAAASRILSGIVLFHGNIIVHQSLSLYKAVENVGLC